MIEFLKKLLGIKEKSQNYTYDGPALEDFNKVITRKDYKIILPYDIEKKLEEDNIFISATKYKGKPSCVQMFRIVNNKSKYVGTLKTFMNVKSFKDGNVCNFSHDNLIYKNEEK